MDSSEARAMLAEHLDRYRTRGYAELAAIVSRPPEVAEVVGASGARYQIEVLCVWDDTPDSTVRVLGAVDDGGWRAFLPLTDGFLMRPDGTFADEDVSEDATGPPRAPSKRG